MSRREADKQESCQPVAFGSQLAEASLSRLFKGRAAYQLLDSHPATRGSTWSAGGCAVLARALAKHIPGSSLVGVYHAGRVQHVAVRHPNGLILDADGSADEDRYLRRWAKREGKANPELRPITQGQIPREIPHPQELVNKTYALLQGEAKFSRADDLISGVLAEAKFSRRFLYDMSKETRNPAVLDKLANSSDFDTVFSVVRSPHSQAQALDRVVENPNFHGVLKSSLLTGVVQHARASSATLNRIFHRRRYGERNEVDDWTLNKLIDHPNVDRNTLMDIARDDSVQTYQRDSARKRLGRLTGDSNA